MKRQKAKKNEIVEKNNSEGLDRRYFLILLWRSYDHDVDDTEKRKKERKEIKLR